MSKIKIYENRYGTPLPSPAPLHCTQERKRFKVRLNQQYIMSVSAVAVPHCGPDRFCCRFVVVVGLPVIVDIAEPFRVRIFSALSSDPGYTPALSWDPLPLSPFFSCESKKEGALWLFWNTMYALKTERHRTLIHRVVCSGAKFARYYIKPWLLVGIGGLLPYRWQWLNVLSWGRAKRDSIIFNFIIFKLIQYDNTLKLNCTARLLL